MRVSAKAERDFQAKVISGTHTILIALDCSEARRHGLMGFAIQREVVGSGATGPKFLRSQKVFRSIEPDPKNARDSRDPSKPKPFYTNDFPIQSFLWGDYAVSPNTAYRFHIMPMYGQPGALTTDPNDEIGFEIKTEPEWDAGITHGVWFNRGAIASQKFAEEFGNKPPTNINDPQDPEVVWLSRGLLEACLRYIDETPAGDALRVAAYEFTYPPVLDALKRALDRGVDVQIVYHDTTLEKGQPNETAMTAAGLPVNDQRITFRRSKTKIPHNKFIVRLENGTDPVEVWTGSTNFTSSGFLGQTNVGHRVADRATAQQFLDCWKVVKEDPDIDAARAKMQALTPDPPEVLDPNSTVRLFSPRTKSAMLDWYGRRMLDAANSVWFTAAFGVTAKLVPPLAQRRDQMRFVLMEKPATAANKKALTQDLTHVVLSYGTPLGEVYTMKNGTPTARKRIKEFDLDKWFFAEEHYRAKNDGFVFFVHTKFLLVDPMADDPLVISGSANFSPGSLLANDENQLLIRGDTRVADIYMTEFDRIFRHFYFRDIANELAGVDQSEDAKAIFLDETDKWTEPYFTENRLKRNRRSMFFATPGTTWFANAAARPQKPAKPRPAPVKVKGGKANPTKKPSATAKAKSKPAKIKSRPAKAKSKPKTKTRPAKTKTKPAKTKTKPAKAKSKPAKIKSRRPARRSDAKPARKARKPSRR